MHWDALAFVLDNVRPAFRFLILADLRGSISGYSTVSERGP